MNNQADPEAFRQDLLNIAQTTLSSKILTGDKVKFAKIAVDAVLRLKGSTNLEHIQVSVQGNLRRHITRLCRAPLRVCALPQTRRCRTGPVRATRTLFQKSPALRAA